MRWSSNLGIRNRGNAVRTANQHEFTRWVRGKVEIRESALTTADAAPSISPISNACPRSRLASIRVASRLLRFVPADFSDFLPGHPSESPADRSTPGPCNISLHLQQNLARRFQAAPTKFCRRCNRIWVQPKYIAADCFVPILLQVRQEFGQRDATGSPPTQKENRARRWHARF